MSGAADHPVERIVPADEVTRARIRELAERPLPLDEWRVRQAIPLTDDEYEGTMALVRWFTRRYPTPAARLDYARRAYRRKTTNPIGSKPKARIARTSSGP